MMTRSSIILLGALLAACSTSPPPQPLPEPVANAREMNELGLESFHAGRYRDALASFHQAERFFLSIDDLHGAAITAISQAEIHILLGERNAAEKVLDSVGAGDEYIRERVKLLRARLLMEKNPEKARRLLLALQDSRPGISIPARLLLCELRLQDGAVDCIDSLDAKDALTAARIAQLQARAALAQGDLETADAFLDNALNIYRELAFRPGIAATHEARAMIATRAGDTPAAIRHLQRALYLWLWMRDRVHAVEALSQLQQLSGETSASYRRWLEALEDDSVEPEWDRLLLEIVRQP